jgi:hypothetical protein
MERLFPWFVHDSQVTLTKRGVYYVLLAAVLNSLNLAIYVAAAVVTVKVLL